MRGIDSNEAQNGVQGDNEMPLKYPWFRIMVAHILTAYLISYFIYELKSSSNMVSSYTEVVVAFMGEVIPNILGLSEVSSNQGLGEIYLFLIWIAMPMYFILFWRLSGVAYYILRKNTEYTKKRKFWIQVIGILAISFIPIFFPRPDSPPNAFAPVAGFEELMNDFFPLFMLVGWSMMVASAMFMSVGVRWTILHVINEFNVSKE